MIALAESNLEDPKPGQSFKGGVESAKGIDSTVGGVTVDKIFENIIKTILYYSITIALLAVVVGGVMYIISLGDESKTARAKKIILYAILGVIIGGAAFAIVLTLESILT